ncbi:MAG: hypothetical protein ACLS85_06215 [Coprobacillus cateniformis]
MLMFGAKYAYTLDGGDIEEYNYENFNAYSAQVEITGNQSQEMPKIKWLLQSMLQLNLKTSLPAQQKHIFYDGYDGFNHLHHLEGGCEKATLEYIIRNHDLTLAKKQINDFKRIKKYLDEKYGYELIKLDIKECI